MLDGDPAPPPQKGGFKFSAHVYCVQTAGWMKLVLGMEVGLSPGDFVLDGDPVPFPKKGGGTPSPIFGPFLLWPNGCMHQNATWYRARPRPRRLSVRWGPRSPLRQRGTAPQFSVHICCGQMAAWIKMSLGMELGLGKFVLDGDPVAPSPKVERTPKFSAHVYCDQTAVWMKLVLGMEVGLRPGDFVLDGDPVALSPKGGGPQIFSPCLL